jgi:hypothetical protein
MRKRKRQGKEQNKGLGIGRVLNYYIEQLGNLEMD